MTKQTPEQQQRDELAAAFMKQAMADVEDQFNVVRAVCPDPEALPGVDMLTGPQCATWLRLFGPPEPETTPREGPI